MSPPPTDTETIWELSLQMEAFSEKNLKADQAAPTVGANERETAWKRGGEAGTQPPPRTCTHVQRRAPRGN